MRLESADCVGHRDCDESRPPRPPSQDKLGTICKMKRECRSFMQVDTTKGVYLPWAVIVKKEGADLRSVKKRFGCVSRLRFAF